MPAGDLDDYDDLGLDGDDLRRAALLLRWLCIDLVRQRHGRMPVEAELAAAIEIARLEDDIFAAQIDTDSEIPF